MNGLFQIYMKNIMNTLMYFNYYEKETRILFTTSRQRKEKDMFRMFKKSKRRTR